MTSLDQIDRKQLRIVDPSVVSNRADLTRNGMILGRLRIGHTKISRECHKTMETLPQCISCGAQLTMAELYAYGDEREPLATITVYV